MPRLGWARCGLRCPLVSRAAAGLPREPSVGRPAGRRRRAAAGPGQGGAGRQGGSAPHPTPPRPVGAVAGPGAPRPGGWGGGRGKAKRGAGRRWRASRRNNPLGLCLLGCLTSALDWARAASGPEPPVCPAPVKKSGREQKEKQSLFFKEEGFHGCFGIF